MMRDRHPLIATWIVVACCLFGSVGYAQDGGSAAAAGDTATAPKAPPTDEQRKEASAHFRRGVELYQEGAFRAALVEFERAYETAPDYRLLYNIGQTRLQIQDYLGATQAYEGYLTQGGGDVPEARRDDVERALEALRERVGRISIAANQDEAEVFVDDQKVGMTPMKSTVSVNVGRHRIYARALDGADATQVIDVAGGDLIEVKLELKSPEAPKPVAGQGGAPVKPPMSPYKKAAIASWSIGGAALAGAVVTGVLAMGAADDYKKEVNKKPADQNKVSDLRSSADAKALATDILGGVAIAGVAAGVVLWLMDDGAKLDDEKKDEKKPATASLEWGVGLGSITARGHF